MLKFIDQWDEDAQILTKKGMKGIERLPTEDYVQAHILGSLLHDSTPEDLRKINCKMNLEWIKDDNGRLLKIEEHTGSKVGSARRASTESHSAARVRQTPL